MKRELLEAHDAWVVSDTAYRRAARLQQSMWRERHGYPIGEAHGKARGDHLEMPWAKETLANYLSPVIAETLANEIQNAGSEGKLYGEPRIYDSLLSSQPLCFNLFAELAHDLDLATRALASRIENLARVESIAFEHSPGRGDPSFTADGSAFDVFIEYRTVSGEHGFVGVEVKYTEDLKDAPAALRPRYDELATAMGCFKPGSLDLLRTTSLQQLWRDHLLAGSLLLGAHGYDLGQFVVLYPAANTECTNAIAQYRQCLLDPDAIGTWELNGFIADLHSTVAQPWTSELTKRYVLTGDLEP